MQNVLVIFQAEKQETESLALAVGLGAVQSGANIRLRHLDPTPSVELAHAGYGTLRTDDLRWAEGVAIILESGNISSLGELRPAFEGIKDDPPIKQKWVYLFHADPESDARRFVEAMFKNSGFQELGDEPSPLPTMEYMTQVGHNLAGKQ
jgi:hypothetical protein